MTKLAAAVIAALAIAIASAAAQPVPGTILQPYVLPVTVNTSSAQAVPANLNRKKIVFFNSSASSKITVCPVISRTTNLALTCTVNGVGGITLLPYTDYVLSSSGLVQPIAMSSAWNAIADNAGSPLTVLEFE
jgi:hypothetical protein